MIFSCKFLTEPRKSELLSDSLGGIAEEITDRINLSILLNEQKFVKDEKFLYSKN